MIMRKGQTALEYLMTYGWAILIVIVAIGALYALGLTKPCRWVGTQVTGFTGGGFEVSTPRFGAASSQLVFDMTRIGASTVNVSTVTGVYKNVAVTPWTNNNNMATGNTTAVTLGGLSGASSGDCYSADVSVNYIDNGRAFTAAGKISGTVEA